MKQDRVQGCAGSYKLPCGNFEGEVCLTLHNPTHRQDRKFSVLASRYRGSPGAVGGTPSESARAFNLRRVSELSIKYVGYALALLGVALVVFWERIIAALLSLAIALTWALVSAIVVLFVARSVFAWRERRIKAKREQYRRVEQRKREWSRSLQGEIESYAGRVRNGDLGPGNVSVLDQIVQDRRSSRRSQIWKAS